MIDDEIRRIALLAGTGAYLDAVLVRRSDNGEDVPEDSVLSVLRVIPELDVAEGTMDALPGQLPVLERQQDLSAAVDGGSAALDGCTSPIARSVAACVRLRRHPAATPRGHALERCFRSIDVHPPRYACGDCPMALDPVGVIENPARARTPRKKELRGRTRRADFVEPARGIGGRERFAACRAARVANAG